MVLGGGACCHHCAPGTSCTCQPSQGSCSASPPPPILICSCHGCWGKGSMSWCVGAARSCRHRRAAQACQLTNPLSAAGAHHCQPAGAALGTACSERVSCVCPGGHGARGSAHGAADWAPGARPRRERVCQEHGVPSLMLNGSWLRVWPSSVHACGPVVLRVEADTALPAVCAPCQCWQGQAKTVQVCTIGDSRAEHRPL